MGEYAPDAIRAVYDALTLPGKQLSGIIGDSAHDYGYHRGRNYVGYGDYSAVLPPDLGGDGEAACGLDVSLPPDQMSAATQRLLNAVSSGDGRTAAVREFYGTVDGYNVVGWDQAYACPATSDSSHLWHIHISVYRQWANDHAVLLPIADVMNGGGSSSSSGGFLMALTDQQQSDIYNWLFNMYQQHGLECVRNVDDGAVYVFGANGWTWIGAGLYEWLIGMRMLSAFQPQNINTLQLNDLLAAMGGVAANTAGAQAMGMTFGEESERVGRREHEAEHEA